MPETLKKYTIERSNQDIAVLHKVKDYLQDSYHHKPYKTDSKVYRDLPELFFNAVKKSQDLQLAIDELTAKLDKFEDLRATFCRLIELSKELESENDF